MTRITERDVYYTLSCYSSKIPLDIKEEIMELKGIKSLAVRNVQSHLDRIVEKGFAECRKRILITNRFPIKGFNPANEYRLTEKGAGNYEVYEK